MSYSKNYCCPLQIVNRHVSKLGEIACNVLEVGLV